MYFGFSTRSFGSPLTAAGKIPSQIKARQLPRPRLRAQRLFQTLPNEHGLRDAPCFGFALELGQEVVRQFQGDRLHNLA